MTLVFVSRDAQDPDEVRVQQFIKENAGILGPVLQEEVAPGEPKASIRVINHEGQIAFGSPDLSDESLRLVRSWFLP